MKPLPAMQRITPLALAISLLSACSSAPSVQPAKPAASSTQARFNSGTLADLENRDIVVATESLGKPSAEEALQNYQTALSLFKDPTARLDTLKRMAELTMHSSQARDMGSEEEAANAKAEERIDAELYERFMQGMAATSNRQVAATYLDMATNIKGDKLTDAEARVSYTKAITLYQEILKSSSDANERAEAYYQLAKAYDLNNQRPESIKTLQQLAKEYPAGNHYVEAEFRIAEDAFLRNRFLEAADAYGRVVKSPKSGDFHDQALYKQGWAYYKASDYDAALPVFFAVTEQLQAKIDRNESAAATATSATLLDDTRHIISLSFIQLDGPKSVAAYFDKNGHKAYEPDIYMQLGETYLSKRMFHNAADTFDFFVAKYPTNPRAPDFSSATIRAYQEGGFPSEVIPAKENFIKRYGRTSAFYAQASDDTRQKLQPLLLGHIIDLAKHNHAEAQHSKKDADYLKAANWYREYLALNPAETEAISINQLLAEALFSAKQFGDAITEFEKTAYGYNNPKAQESAYFALVAYQELEKGLKAGEPDEKAWFEKRTASSLKYAEHFPADSNTPTILQGLTNDQLARKDIPAAMKTAGVIVQLQPPASPQVQREAWQVIGDGEFDLGRPAAAEIAYHKVLTFPDLEPALVTKYQDRLAASIYKQAEKLRDENNIDGAVAAFLRVADVGGNSKLKPAARYDAATLLLNAERYSAAIPVLEGFRRDYPQHELNSTVPLKLATAYEKTEQFDRAAREYEGIASASLKTEPELSREALWTAAELYGKASLEGDSMRLYRQYVATHPQPMDVNAEAQFKLLQYAEKRQDTADAEAWLKSLAQTYNRAGASNTPRTTYLGAMAYFRLNQPLYDQFVALPLNQPLKKSLATKRAAMQQALDAYTRTAAIGVAEFTTASNYQIADIYRRLAADLMASERPKGLSELELEQYDILLEEQATPFEDKALDIYIANVALTKQGVYDAYVRKSFEALAKLSPGRYNRQEQLETLVDVIY